LRPVTNRGGSNHNFPRLQSAPLTHLIFHFHLFFILNQNLPPKEEKEPKWGYLKGTSKVSGRKVVPNFNFRFRG